MKEPLTRDMDFTEGVVLVVDKPIGWTSSDVVRKVNFSLRKMGYKKVKVGHAGTLDPLATGVLIICLGRATKRVEELQAQTKEYVAEVILGATTPSFDMEHTVDYTYPWRHITREATESALLSLCGERLQTPPVYSAKMIEGRRAYEYAREGSEVTMRQALVNIYNIELLEFDLPRIKIRVECSKGTYIRSLAGEIGEALHSGGFLSSLRRTRSGGYAAEDGYSVDEIVQSWAVEKKNV